MSNILGKTFICIKAYGPIKVGTIGICIEDVQGDENFKGYFRLSLATPVLGTYEVKVSRVAMGNFSTS